MDRGHEHVRHDRRRAAQLRELRELRAVLREAEELAGFIRWRIERIESQLVPVVTHVELEIGEPIAA